MKSKILLLLVFFVFSIAPAFASGGGTEPAYTNLKGGGAQYSKFPKPLEL